MATATLGPAGYTVSVRSGRHQLTADEPKSAGGADAGPTPMDLLLSALTACTAITLRMYAERKGWQLAGIQVDARFGTDPADEGRHVHRIITLDGDLDAAQRERLGEIAARTPVTRIVAEGREVSTSVR